MSTAEPLRLGFVSLGWSPDAGGIESHLADLARELLARGHRVEALCVDRRAELAPYEVRDDYAAGARVRRMGAGWGAYTALRDLVRDRRAEEVVRRWVCEREPALVHVHHLSGFGVGALEVLAEEPGPVVATLHDYWLACPRGQLVRGDRGLCARPEPATCGACLASTWPALMPSGGGEAFGPAGEAVADDAAAAEARTRFALAGLEQCRRVLVPSEGARAACARAGLAPERLAVCANGIEAGWLAAEVARLRRAGFAPRAGVALGVLGSVQPSKGVLELARVVADVEADDLRLEIHGALAPYHGDETYVEELRALARADRRVELRGPYERGALPRVLARLDGVAVPSLWDEPFGLGAREARAAGLPVLVSDVGGLAVAVRHEEDGLVLPPGDAEGWRAAVARFARDSAARARWSAAPARVRDVLDMALELEALYGDCLSEAAATPPG